MDNHGEKNTSGQGKNKQFPPGVRGWSWGAFLMTWVWGIGNNTYRAFWIFVPIVNIVMWIALGIRGREWAWRNRHWQSVAAFNRTQRKWAIAGFIITALSLIIWLTSIAVVFHALNNGRPTELAIEIMQHDTKFKRLIGSPIEKTGLAKGNIHVTGTGGNAFIYFPVQGASAKGTIKLIACKAKGEWYINHMVFVNDFYRQKSFHWKPKKFQPCNYAKRSR